MVDIPEISAVVVALGVLFGIVYYVLDLRHRTRERKTDLVMRLLPRIMSDKYLDAYEKLMTLEFKDKEENLEMEKAYREVFGPLELVGVLLYRKHIDLITVYDVFGSVLIKSTFEKVKPLILAHREKANEPLIGMGFEYLYTEISRKEPQLRETWARARSLIT